MSEILAVAESVWRRILSLFAVYFLAGCAVTLTGISFFYKHLMAGRHRMLMIDVSLLLTAIAGLLCVLALAFDVPRELREGAATTLLSKPLGRTQYLLGKFVGIVIVSLVITGIITAGFCIIHQIAFDVPAKKFMPAFKAHLLTMGSVAPMAAISLLFASIFPEAPAAIMTFIAVFVLNSLGSLPAKVTAITVWVLPDLTLFNLRSEASHSLPIEWSYVGLAVLWGLLISAAVIALTGIIFNRRDLK